MNTTIMPINISEATLSEMSDNVEAALNVIRKSAVYHQDRRMTMLRKYEQLQDAIHTLWTNGDLIRNDIEFNKNLIWMVSE